jgi:hypothetical protein
MTSRTQSADHPTKGSGATALYSAPPVAGPKPKPGPIEEAVAADITSLGELTRIGQGTLAALALKLARVLDVRGDEEPASQTAKAVDTLRITMGKLTEVDSSDPDTQAKLAALLSSPNYGGSAVSAEVRYPQKPGAADARRGRGKGRQVAR